MRAVNRTSARHLDLPIHHTRGTVISRRKKDPKAGSSKRFSLFLCLKRFVVESVSVDVRGVQLARTMLGCLVLLDLWIRAPLIDFYQTDDGARGVREALPDDWAFSPHIYFRSYTAQVLLNSATALAANGMILGDFPRTCAFFTWWLWRSMISENEDMLQGGDHILAGGLFFLSILPHTEKQRRPSSFLLYLINWLGQLGFVLWLFGIYWGSYFGRSGSLAWNKFGTAVSTILHDENLATFIGRVLRKSPTLCYFLTHGSMICELVSPILILFPIGFEGLFRFLGVVSLQGLHLGLGLSIDLRFFQAACFFILLPLLPSEAYDKAAKCLPHPGRIFQICITNIPYFQRLYQVAKKVVRRLKRTKSKFSHSESQHGHDIESTMTNSAPKLGKPYKRRAWRRALGFVGVVGRIFLLFAGYAALLGMVGIAVPGKLDRIIPLRAGYSFYTTADRMVSGFWQVPGLLRNGQVIDLWEHVAPNPNPNP
ncbi:hypothetical protein AAMO2058_000473800, partial [Amorphochlora amoebiformis]